MIRRNARLIQQFQYRKQKEAIDGAIYDKKRKIKAAIDSGKSIPTELRQDELELRDSLQFDDEYTITTGLSETERTVQLSKTSARLKRDRDPKDDEDVDSTDPKDLLESTETLFDEYSQSDNLLPKICITSSRNPSSRLGKFTKEMTLIFPNCTRMNRGHMVLKQLIDACSRHNYTDLIVCHETRGEPDGLLITHLPVGPTIFFTLYNVVLRHDVQDLETVPQVYPQLIFENFKTKIGHRTIRILQHLFPPPKPTSSRVLTFSTDNDFISFRHHSFVQKGDRKQDITLKEIGPRFEMHLVHIRRGTCDQIHADYEFKWAPYLNTAQEKTFL